MRKRLILIAALLCAAAVLSAKSRIETFTVKSEVLGCEKICNVYLPDGYDESDCDYPVMYLLHGLGGWYNTWTKDYKMAMLADMQIEATLSVPMIIVMPDASGELENRRGNRPGYANRKGWMYEDFFFQEFIPAVESHYRIKAEKSHRAIAGLSMGGHGTALYAFKHPDCFSSAYVMSGRLKGSPDLRDDNQLYYECVRDNEIVKMVDEASEQKIKEIGTVNWFLDCGDDDYLLEGSLELYLLFRNLGVRSELRVRNGAHKAHYWMESLPMAMNFASMNFGK